MSAYVILDIEVLDREVYEEYKAAGAPTIRLYGGKPLVRGGRAEILEGDINPNRLVMIEFGSVEEARRWWNSPEYSKARELRSRAARTKAFIVEGL